jgi:hypothetical protein
MNVMVKMMFSVVGLMCFAVIGSAAVFNIICGVSFDDIPSTILWFI